LRIGLSGAGASTAKVVEQAREAEADGFSALWYAYATLGDPLVAMAIAGRETKRIELGTAVVQTYPCHPLLMANRVASVTDAMERPGFTLGIGPAHRPVVEGVYGLSYASPGANTEEYAKILAGLLRNEVVDFDGEHWSTHSEHRSRPLAHPASLLISALGPRLLRVAGEIADGTVLWLATATAIERHVAPAINAAATGAGRPAPRIVAGLPVAVHDDVAEARAAQAGAAAIYDHLPNYQRVLELGGVSSAPAAAIVGDEAAVSAQLQGLLDAGATEIWAAMFPVGEDKRTSLRRTRELLMSLVD